MQHVFQFLSNICSLSLTSKTKRNGRIPPLTCGPTSHPCLSMTNIRTVFMQLKCIFNYYSIAKVLIFCSSKSSGLFKIHCDNTYIPTTFNWLNSCFYRFRNRNYASRLPISYLFPLYRARNLCFSSHASERDRVSSNDRRAQKSPSLIGI